MSKLHSGEEDDNGSSVPRKRPTAKASNCATRFRDLAYRSAGHAYHIEIKGLAEPLKAEVLAESIEPFAVGDEVWFELSDQVSIIQ